MTPNIKKKYVGKILLTCLGMFFAALGVSFSVEARLGTSAIGSVPAVISEASPITTGTAMWLMMTVFVVIQIIILRKGFPLLQYVQFILSILYGFFIDFTTWLLTPLSADTMVARGICCGLGIVSLAWGVFILTKTEFLMLPPEALIMTITKKTRFQFHRMKIAFDCTVVGVAALLSVIFLHKVVHVGVGTLLAMIFVGVFIGWFNKCKKLVGFFDIVKIEKEQSK